MDENKENKSRDPRNEDENSQEMFETQEVEIEEMAIDGICGVY